MGKPTMDELRARTRGRVITRDDPEYERARKVYNAMIDRRPRVVVQCVDAADVIATVDFARENGLDLSIRGGSHSVPGFGTNDEGVVIDLGPMGGDRGGRIVAEGTPEEIASVEKNGALPNEMAAKIVKAKIAAPQRIVALWRSTSCSSIT